MAHRLRSIGTRSTRREPLGSRCPQDSEDLDMTGNEQKSVSSVRVATRMVSWRHTGYAIAAIALVLAGPVRSLAASTTEGDSEVVDRARAQQIIRDLRAVSAARGVEELQA